MEPCSGSAEVGNRGLEVGLGSVLCVGGGRGATGYAWTWAWWNRSRCRKVNVGVGGGVAGSRRLVGVFTHRKGLCVDCPYVQRNGVDVQIWFARIWMGENGEGCGWCLKGTHRRSTDVYA
ncbi:hypothetical protein PIB30_097130 [Stylosanthes scabra]|uniref:Uncharacterized protein n=1 Tax=Stylosanthes scabra TaxID=79078 RepID=A0ABU6SYN1_9FABA|nr:hypothetical protein [Stylosanthes scabra]